MTDGPTERDTRHLHAGELADAAVSAALVFGLLGFGRLMSAGSFFSIVSAVVLSVLMARRRLRALIFATAAGPCWPSCWAATGPSPTPSWPAPSASAAVMP